MTDSEERALGTGAAGKIDEPLQLVKPEEQHDNEAGTVPGEEVKP